MAGVSSSHDFIIYYKRDCRHARGSGTPRQTPKGGRVVSSMQIAMPNTGHYLLPEAAEHDGLQDDKGCTTTTLSADTGDVQITSRS